jgi:integrase
VPVAVIAAWLGHADPAFTRRTYLHSQDDACAAPPRPGAAVVTSV